MGPTKSLRHSYSTLNCSAEEYFCVSPYTNELMCLPIERVNNGHIGCLYRCYR